MTGAVPDCTPRVTSIQWFCIVRSKLEVAPVRRRGSILHDVQEVPWIGSGERTEVPATLDEAEAEAIQRIRGAHCARRHTAPAAGTD